MKQSKRKTAILWRLVFPLVLAVTVINLVVSPVMAVAQSSCYVPIPASWPTGGFSNADFDFNGINVSGGGTLQLDTGSGSLDPSNVVIPVEQDIYSVFIMEGADYLSDFGWFLKAEADTKYQAFKGSLPTANVSFSDIVSAGVTINYLFHNIRDDGASCCDGGDGILDNYYDDAGAYLGSSGGLTEATLESYGFSPISDGTVDPSDMRKYMGKFASGTEIVFFINANGSNSNTWYSKDNWSTDTWNQSTRTLVLNLGACASESAGCPSSWVGSTRTQGWIATPGISRLSTYFGVTMSGSSTLSLTNGSPYNHYMLGAPPTDPNKWILGVEDLSGGGDGDFNDLVIMIERSTGGTAQLKSTKALGLATDAGFPANGYILSATFEVRDFMPSASCSGTSEINYFLSLTDGNSWVEISDWDTVTDSGGSTVSNWSYGNPEETTRTATVSFSEYDMTGQNLIWKAEMISSDDSCMPEVYSVDIAYTVSENAEYSGSSPVTLGNVIYSSSYETPDITWTEMAYRGHLRSSQLYDPEVVTAWNVVENWDAGSVLTARTPNTRDIYYPNITTTDVSGEIVGAISGAGVTSYSGTITNTSVTSGSITVTATVGSSPVTYTESSTGVLSGSPSGSGTLNRYTGVFTIDTFAGTFDTGTNVVVDYTYASTPLALTLFTTGSTDYGLFGLTDDGAFEASGFEYKYDFDDSGGVDENDADWLANWVTGYSDGSTTAKEWVLGAIDHSTPAIVGSPGLSSWYFGKDVTSSERDDYDVYRCQQKDRQTVTFAGARDGQLHAFYSGEYRPYYIDPSFAGTCITSDMTSFRTATNPLTYTSGGEQLPYYPGPTGGKTIPISRGYYDWQSRGGACGSGGLSNSGSAEYGNGCEIYAVIPSDQMAKLKNNPNNEDGGSYVDASPSATHARFSDGSWNTVVMSAEGNGGDTIFAINVTDATSPTFLWEFSDVDLFRSRSSPSVGSVGRVSGSGGAKWAVFFVSGITYNSTQEPSVFMVDVETGEVLDRIYLDSAGIDGQGGVPSGQPALVDSDGNGYVDRFYIGTDKGFVYKVTIPDDPDGSSGSVSECLFFDTASGSGSTRQSIYASPAVLVRNTLNGAGETEYKIDVFFGTSDSPYQDDYVPGETYYFYSVRDTDSKGSCSTGTKQWDYALAAGEKVFASAFASAGRVYFGTTTAETSDPCSLPGSGGGTPTGSILVFDADGGAPLATIATGSVTTTPLVDDEHVFVKTDGGELKGLGGATFQNPITQGGIGDATVGSWMEITR